MQPTAIGVWINDNIFVAKGSSLDDISLNDKKALHTSLFNIINSKFKYTHNITIDRDSVDITKKSIKALLCISDTGILSYLGNSHIVEHKFIILQKDDILCSIVNGDFIEFTYYYTDGITPFGNGKNTYIVNSLVRDEYEIYINADSESEAIAKANLYEIKDWNHLDLDTGYDDRVLLRAARWGNFKVRKI